MRRRKGREQGAPAERGLLLLLGAMAPGQLPPLRDPDHTHRPGQRRLDKGHTRQHPQRGQPPPPWQHIVTDMLILAQCGRGHVEYLFSENRWHNSNEDFGDQRKINGTTFKGLEMTVPIGKWTPGADETSCVAEAIKKASCGVELNFTNGSCYRKPGTQLVPITVNE